MDRVGILSKAIYQYLENVGQYPNLICMHPDSFNELVNEIAEVLTNPDELQVNNPVFMGIKIETDEFMPTGVFYLYD